MPSLVPQLDMNSYDYDRGGPARINGTNGGFDYNRDDLGREDMRREDDDRYRRGVRNGGPSFDARFNTDYLEQTSLSDFRSNEPKFELDHLATFAAGSRNGVIHAEDGLRKLRQMENTTGIWTMRCVLIVERGNLVLLDNSTGEELERFPIQQVQDPTAIFKNDRREIYNNLILFTIVDDAKRRGSAADMHIFQSCKSPSQEIVDEILAAKNGQQRRYPPGGGSRIPPPPVGPAPEPPYDLQGMSFGDKSYQTNFVGQQRSFITRVGDLREKEDYTGGTTEILERDVQLLNHCFDDVEKFVARLQQAAEAFKELEKRKRDRGAKNKKRQLGDGMLNARARPPPDKDFVDIFQKFKLSFNLLAKLKAHIHDPNAPELVHFLFTPLSLIYEASRDPFHGNQNLGDQAVAPVLTADAKQLLNNCLTTKEVELWQALGKHWTTSRDEWNGHIPPYVPEFYDGWQPAATILDDMPARSMISQPVDDRPPRNFGPPPPRPMPFPDEDHRYYRNNIPEDTFDRKNAFTHAVVEPKPPTPKLDDNAAYFDELRRTGDAIIYEAAHDRTGKNDKELTVQKGDILQVLDNSRNWWKLRNYKGEVGFAPYTILKPVKTDFDSPQNDRGLTNGGGAMPQSYRSDHYIDDNSSRRGASRRDSENSAVFSEAPSHQAFSNKGQPRVAPRRGSEPARPSDAATVMAGAAGHSGPPAAPRSRPPMLKRARAHTVASDQTTMGREDLAPNFRILSLSALEGSKLNPESHDTPRRVTRTSITSDSNFDPGLMEDLNSKSDVRDSVRPLSSASSGQGTSRDRARSSSSNSAGQGIPAKHAEEALPGQTDSPLLEPKIIRPRNSQRSLRGDDVTHISERSSAVEVTEWLTNKNFSDRAIQVFQGQNGLDMFHLRLSDFQQLLGHDEATRLDGLLTLQKNSSGYGTRSAKELTEILQRRKQHVTETENNYEEQETLERRRPEPQLIEPQTPQQLKKKLEERQQSFKRTTQGPDYRVDPSGASFQQQLIRQRSQLRQSESELDEVLY